jgi:hypothetical protein
MTCAVLSVNNYFAKNYVAAIPRLCYVFPIAKGNVQMSYELLFVLVFAADVLALWAIAAIAILSITQ